jgi:GT2 family glycosyltransferase
MPSSTRPRIAIVTVLYNSIPVLPEFLTSLSAQTSTDWQLIAIDNASNDRGVAMTRAWQKGAATVIANTANVGFAVATNQGIRLAQQSGFDAVLLLNNDTVFEADFLQGLGDALIRHPGDILAPVVLYHDTPERAWYAGGGFTWSRGAFQAHASEHLPAADIEHWPATFAPGCALLVPTPLFDKIGLLDERFFVYWEDADFCLRCKQAGERITVLRTPVIRHKVSTLTEGETSPFSVRMYQQNQIRFLRKHLGTTATVAQLPLIIAKAMFRYATRREPWAVTRLRLDTIAATLRKRE